MAEGPIWGWTGSAEVLIFLPRLQEVNCKINKRLKDALFTDQWSELFMDVLSPFHFVLVRQTPRGWAAGAPSLPVSEAGWAPDRESQRQREDLQWEN